MITSKTSKSILLAAFTALTAIAAQGAVIFQDNFTYPDGSLTNGSAGTWFYHSISGANELNVQSGQALVQAGTASDASANLAGAPYASTSLTAALYAKFTINATALPTAAGAYVLHFKDAATGTQFRARVGLNTTGAGAGAYRVGIANTGSTFNNIGTDLLQNTTYTIVVRYVLATGASTIWLEPINETSTSVTASDTLNTANAMSCISLRQAAGGGTVLIDDLVVGTTFADVVPSSTGFNPVFITRQPVGGSVSAGIPFSFTNVAGGDQPLSYEWRKDNAAISGATSSIYTIASTTVGDTGDYTVVVGNTSGSITSSIASLTVTASATAPSITNQPASQIASWGQNVTFSVGAEGTSPLSYQWRFYGTNITGATSAFYTRTGVFTNHAGPYTVVITNVAGAITSSPAILTVNPPPTTNIAYLHTTVDTVNYVPTNTTTLFTVEGIVTSHQNLTPATNALFYLQDSSAGIACFWAGDVSGTLPPAGALVRITAPLASFNGVLELAPVAGNALHSVQVISSNNPLPALTTLPFDAATQSDPAIMDILLEGKYVVASNVFIELTTPTFVSGVTCLLTNNLGETFTMFANANTDVAGQTKPVGPVTIIGVLSQFDTTNPRTSGYQIIPTRFEDVLSQAKAPTVRFTNYLSNLVRPGQPTPNTFPEGVLRPGEKLTMTVNVVDPDDGNVTITPLTAGLPASASWTTGVTSGTNVSATFTFEPINGDAGVNYTIALRSVNAFVTTTNRWFIYVPSAVEQQVFITEFLANPTSDTNLLHFNPLHRTTIPSSVTVMDEYIEIVNQSPTDIDLYDWSVADAVGVRHRFYNGAPLESLAASNAIIVFGGPANTDLPVLPVPAFAASESTSTGLALNNTGTETITLRNGTNIIDRLQYAGTSLSAAGSLVRFPTLNSPFVPQNYVGTNTSAGVQYDGSNWTAPATVPTGVAPITITYGNPVVLNYTGIAGQAYTLWQANEANQPFTVVNGGIIANAAGAFYITNAPANRQFYFITKP